MTWWLFGFGCGATEVVFEVFECCAQITFWTNLRAMRAIAQSLAATGILWLLLSEPN